MEADNKKKINQESQHLSLKLPFDYQITPNVSANRKSTISFSFNKKTSHHLARQHSRQNTIFLAAAVTSLLYRYTQQTKIPLSVSFSHPCKKHISVRMGTHGKLKFNQLCEQMRLAVSEETVLIDSSEQVHFSMDESCGHLDRDNNQADLHLNIQNSSNYRIIYKTDVFKANTINRMGGHFQNIIDFILDRGDESELAELALFSKKEALWYARAGSGGVLNYPLQPVHVDIEKHVLTQPNKTAVSYHQDSLTYEELNVRSNQLANFVLTLGVGPESRILVCLEPSVDIAVALLAVLKAGATYVPLNPSHPEYRNKTIIEDTHPDFLITHSSIAKTHNFQGVPSIELDDDKKLGGHSPSNPSYSIDPSQTAYIYYTSGTTGKPKGSKGSYSNLNHYIRVAQEKYGFSNAEIMPALASYTFSISMFELLSPLVAGGTLKILDRRHILDAEAMVKTMQQVTSMHAGPSLLKGLVKYIGRNVDDYSVFKGLRHLSSGGDMVPANLLRKLQLIFQTTELYVIYGCSEIGCMGCTYPVDQVRPVEKTYVGKPFKNVSILILDKDDNIVPIGVTGEVCIGGNGVATGYLNRPELTSEKFFVRDNIRYYKTGDVGKLNPEGQLELLGREDFQIQIHGMRVELSEVEYHLRQAAAVLDAVVVAKKHGAIDRALVAYYVKNGNYQIDAELLRRHMMQYVPDYMVPSFYVQLDALPLNINMKLDRKALLEKDIVFVDPIEKPQTQSQLELVKIWSALLQTDRIGLFDNFMNLGGDSLLAMEMISRVREFLGVKLDGLSILRESLEVLAAICDSQLGRSPTFKNDQLAGSISHLSTQISPVTSFFFGHDSSLYGLLHMRQELENRQAVLICPPIGTAYKRCYFLLKILGDQLADSGIPAMRFDYFGTHDSLGEDREATIERWLLDIKHAYQELQGRTGARVMVLGIRLGALLALNSLAEEDVHSWVFWDPVLDGNHYYQQLLSIQKHRIRRSRTLRGYAKPKSINDGEELVGFTYSSRAILELRALGFESINLLPGIRIHQLRTLDNTNSFERKEWVGTLNSSVVLNDINCRWSNPYSISSTIIDKRISDWLVEIFIKEHGQGD